MTDTEMKPSVRRPAVVTAILIALAALTVGAVILLTCLLAIRHRDFQNASDYQFVKTWLANTEITTLREPLLPYLRERLTPYEGEDDLQGLLTKTVTAETITIARADSYTEEVPVFTLFAQGREILLLTLANKGNGPGGHPRWAMDSLVLSPRCALGRDLTLEVPKGATVTVNGRAPEISKAETVSYHALSEFETALAEEFACDRYSLGVFFSDPSISVILDDRTLAADSLDGSVLRYAYPSSYTTALSLTVPYGSTVKLNGIPLSGQYQVESGIPYPFLTRFEADLPDAATAVVYQVAGLFRKPAVEVLYDHTLLTEVEDGVYRLPEEQTNTVTVCAPNYATVKLNGISLGVTEMAGVRYDLPILDGVTNYVKERPLMVRYQVSGLLANPVITAFDQNGHALSVSPFYSTEEETVFSGTDAGAVPDKELLTLRTFAKSYITYLYSGSSKISSHYNDVISMTPSKSNAYSLIKKAYKTIQTADVHTSIKYGTIEALHYTAFSEKAYAAILKVPFTSKLDGQKLSHTVTMEVLYIYSGNIRRIVNYTVLETVSQAVE